MPTSATANRLRDMSPAARQAFIDKLPSRDLSDLVAELTGTRPKDARAKTVARLLKLLAVSAVDPAAPAVPAGPRIFTPSEKASQKPQDGRKTDPPKTAARKVSKPPKGKPKASEGMSPRMAKMLARAKEVGLKAGQTLRRMTGGEVLECLFDGQAFVFRGERFESISAAANEAARVTGQRSTTIDGWIYWGLVKREKRPRKAA